MTLRSTLLASTLLATLGSAQAATIHAPSRIDQVVLYPDAALIVRQVSVEFPAGTHDIVLADLPLTADPASLRVEASGSSRLVIGGIDIKLGAGDTQPDAALAARLKTALEARDRLSDRIEASEGRKAMINRLAQRDPAPTDGKPLDLESWLRAVDAVGKGLQATNDELRGLRIEQTKLEEDIAVLEAAIGKPSAPQPKRLASIAIEATEAGKATLMVSYRVHGASWRPVYDARLDTRSAKPGLELTRRALLRQRTGEDWRDARITLSTLRVQRGTAAPVLNTQRFGFFEQPVPAPMPRSPAAASAPVPEAMMMQAETRRQRNDADLSKEIAATEQQAQVDTTAFQAEFTLSAPVTLPSGNEERSFRLASASIAPELQHKATPALDTIAYLEAAFTLPGDAPLLAGEVLLSRDGAFIGRNRVNDTAPGDQLKLGFGADERVNIKRIPVMREARDPGLLSSTRSEENRFRIDIRNLHAFPVKVQIVDRLPVSEDQQITIERLPDMTKPDLENLDDKRGVFAWNATLAPQEAKSFTTAWRMRWPQGRIVRPMP
ncbi:MAG: mucoidy inhibitor MuiA family protein [Rhabdaerophilum sp.]